MINLLNPNEKRIIRAGKRNRDWSRYIFLTIAALGILVFISTITFFVFDTEEISKRNIEKENNQKNNSEIAKTDKLIDSFTKNIQILQAIENNKIRYSSLLVYIAKGLPEGCAMSTLSISGSTLGKTPQTFEISCLSENGVVVKLKNSQIFRDVQIISINYDSAKETSSVKISFNAIIQKPTDGSGARS